MTSKPDTWNKPRGHGKHLTPEEIALIQKLYVDGLSVRYTAERLLCSSRTVQKYYGFFAAEGVVRRKPL